MADEICKECGGEVDVGELCRFCGALAEGFEVCGTVKLQILTPYKPDIKLVAGKPFWKRGIGFDPSDPNSNSFWK